MKTPELMAEQEQARIKRRAFAGSRLSGLANRMQAVVADYLKARAGGMDRDLACKGIEAELRELMPLTKYPPVHTCDACEDIGFRHYECEGDEGPHGPICGRRFVHGAHTFVRFCDCAKGQAIERKVKPPVDDAAVEAAARSASRKRVSNWRRAGQ